jgi:hypothetical protein
MTRRDQVLHRASLALFGIAILIMVIGMIVMDYSHNLTITGILGIVAAVFLIPGWIISKISDKATQERIDNISLMMQQMDLVPAQAEDFQWLDCETLNKWTSELTSLGFKNLGDYTLGTGGITVEGAEISQPFSKVMVNENHKCFAEIGQSMHPKTVVKDATCSIVTFFVSGIDCRTVNSNAPLPTVTLPFSPNIFQKPGAQPAELLQLHLEQRDKLVKDGQVIDENTSFETYRQHFIDLTNHMQEWMNQRIRQANDRAR